MSAERETYDMKGTRLVALTCDRCGKRDERNNRTDWFPEGGTLSFSFGYGSSYDLSDPTYDLCDPCAKAVVEFIKGNADDLEGGWSS